MTNTDWLRVFRLEFGNAASPAPGFQSDGFGHRRFPLSIFTRLPDEAGSRQTTIMGRCVTSCVVTSWPLHVLMWDISEQWGKNWICGNSGQNKLKNEFEEPIRQNICPVRADLTTGLKGFNPREHDSYASFSFIRRKQNNRRKTSCFCRWIYSWRGVFCFVLSEAKRFPLLSGWLALSDRGVTCSFSDEWLTGVTALSLHPYVAVTQCPSALYIHLIFFISLFINATAALCVKEKHTNRPLVWHHGDLCSFCSTD